MEEVIEKSKFYQYKHFKLIVVISAILLLIVLGFFFKGQAEEKQAIEPIEITKKIEIQKVADLQPLNLIQVVGGVKSETSVDVVALTRGTVEAVLFEEGDEIMAGTTLASIFDSTTVTSLNNALTSFNNAQFTYNSAKNLAEDSYNQAKLGAENAKNSLEAAEVGLQSAEDAYNNGLIIQKQNNEDTRRSAVINYQSYVTSIDSALNQVNYLIKAEGAIQMPGVEHSLGILNPTTKSEAKKAYLDTKGIYDYVSGLTPTEETIVEDMKAMVSTLTKMQDLLSKVTNLLNNSVAHANFPEESLNTQKAAFSGLRTSMINSYTGAQSTLDALENMTVYNKQESDALTNALNSAKKQLDIAEVNYKNAQIALTAAESSRDQQILTAQSALDGASGQLNLAQAQSNYLIISAPIEGKIAQKNVSVGQQLNPGQKIAEIHQSGLVKITISLPSEEIYKVYVGQPVFVNNNLDAVVTKIAPVADSLTKKVEVEIIYDNSNNDLIPGTFVDVDIIIEDDQDVTSFFVPLSSVTISQIETYVFIYEDGKVKKQNVELGKISGVNVEILSGLDFEDQLVIEGSKLVSDGEEVELKQ